MSSRGSVAKNGHVGTEQYETVAVCGSGAKVLVGKGGNHGLPDFSHSPNAVYVKHNASGTFVTIRFYGEDRRMFLEIAYHPEPSIGKPGVPVWHYHTYDSALDHGRAQMLTEDMVERYRVYLEEAGYGKSRP